MQLTHTKLRELFSQFWEELPRNHKLVPPAPLTLQEDPTTLFTSSGMQPIIPYLAGEPHPLGKRVYNIQPSIRTQDIEEVGDNRHTTFFEMMGNWSLGDYFKEEQLSWCWEFYTKVIGIPQEKIYITVFEGNKDVPKDEESVSLWKKLGVQENHIYYYGVDKNWWSRSGPPEKMPPGEIGGPDSEMFYEFDTPHDPKYGNECHPNCDCGRFMEFANSVFIQYKKNSDGSLTELPQKNVDFGGGLERLAAIVNNDPDVFKSDLFSKIINGIVDVSKGKYENNENQSNMRIIADHMKAAMFLIRDGVIPSNKEHGYILRRMLRRSAIKLHKLMGGIRTVDEFMTIVNSITNTYNEKYNLLKMKDTYHQVIASEVTKFANSINSGMKQLEKYETITGKMAFDLYQSYGFPLEITEELIREKGRTVNHEEFKQEFNKHKELSRSASAGMFKGGLADHSEQTVRYHTATHLLHQALFDVLGNDVRQEGSNITAQRLRFDFSTSQKPTDEQIKNVETIMNEKTQQGIPVSFKILPKDEASKLGAKSFFKEKYPDQVKVYYIGDDIKIAYSKELCGGPHVGNTKEIGTIEIYKLEKIGSNLYRIYAK